MWPGILTGIGLGLLGYSAFEQKDAQEEAINANLSIGQQKANLTRKQAELERQQTARNAALIVEQASNLQSTQVGAYTASGVWAGEGTPLAMLQNTRNIGAQDYGNMMTTGENQAKFMEQQALLMEQGANIEAQTASRLTNANFISNLANIGVGAFNYFYKPVPTFSNISTAAVK